MTEYTMIIETTITGLSAYAEGMDEGLICTTGKNRVELVKNIHEAIELYRDGDKHYTFTLKNA